MVMNMSYLTITMEENSNPKFTQNECPMDKLCVGVILPFAVAQCSQHMPWASLDLARHP